MKNNKYIFRYNEAIQNFNIQDAINKIKAKFKYNDLKKRFEKEIKEWVDPNWKKEYKSEYEWYMNNNNGEAQEVIIEEILSWYQKTHGKLTDDVIKELTEKIIEEYDFLRYNNEGN